ncbi:MAG: TULIP family P47-like protein [Boseongicola sp.]|nr:MAG: TULIP family P47-like protein [Boseongicola sp.]
MPLTTTARGWDMVSSIHIDTLNEAIVIGQTTPDGFSQLGDDDVSVSADFEPWQISPDGDGKILTLDMDLNDLTIDYGSKVKKFAKATARVDVRLDLLPLEQDTAKCAAMPKQTMLLVLDTDGDHKTLPARVTGVEITGGSGIMDEGYAGAALQSWLQDNLVRFTHIFAAITLYRTVEHGEDFA